MHRIKEADVRDVLLDHIERLADGYDRRAKETATAAGAACGNGDGWTEGLERGLGIAYRIARDDLRHALKVERSLYGATRDTGSAT